MSLSVAVLTCKLGPARNGLGKGGTANSPRVLPTEIEKMAPVGYGGTSREDLSTTAPFPWYGRVIEAFLRAPYDGIGAS
jgi:hypothetical protein